MQSKPRATGHSRQRAQTGGIKPEDIGLVECNKAFATQTIHDVREMGFSEDIVNVHGGGMGGAGIFELCE